MINEGRSPKVRDHPRIRGTNSFTSAVRLATVGSPPHTRDKSVETNVAKTEKRITPAYAGQIYGSMPTSENDGDHPRIRGTNKAEVPLLSHPIGSPPHTRDKFFFVLAISDSLRITPAYAGQIHPVAMTVVLLVGSPPHTRDKLTAPPLFPCPFRITPAYAGQIS